MSLTNSQIKSLKKKAHALKPIIWVGQKGINENLLDEVSQALAHHELIKVKLRVGEREERDTMIDKIIEETHAENIQRVGNILTLFKQAPNDSAFKLPI